MRRDVSIQHRECPRRCDRTPGAGHGGTKLHARPQRTRHAPSRRLTSSWPRMATLLDEIKGDRAAPPRAGPVVPQRHHDGVSDDRGDPVAGPCPPAGHLTSFTNAICRPQPPGRGTPRLGVKTAPRSIRVTRRAPQRSGAGLARRAQGEQHADDGSHCADDRTLGQDHKGIPQRVPSPRTFVRSGWQSGSQTIFEVASLNSFMNSGIPQKPVAVVIATSRTTSASLLWMDSQKCPERCAA
jgi:hypothetical protein